MAKLIYSVVVPVYLNQASLPELIDALAAIHRAVAASDACELEVVFVVDGSPDGSHRILRSTLPTAPFRSKLLLHSKNFGSFAAIRSGLAVAGGEYFAVMAADLQEPPELVVEFLRLLVKQEIDVVVGTRRSRADPVVSRFASWLFWRFYRWFVMPEIPAGGVDIFGCNRRFREELLRLEERNSSLVGLLFWLGFRRKEVAYERRKRKSGRSAWTLRRKMRYLFDSVFSFTDLPIHLLIGAGLIGVIASIVAGGVIVLLRASGTITVPGYAATVLIVMFFGGLNSLGLGIVGTYAWRAFENTKGRPYAVLLSQESFSGDSCSGTQAERTNG